MRNIDEINAEIDRLMEEKQRVLREQLLRSEAQEEEDDRDPRELEGYKDLIALGEKAGASKTVNIDVTVKVEFELAGSAEVDLDAVKIDDDDLIQDHSFGDDDGLDLARKSEVLKAECDELRLAYKTYIDGVKEFCSRHKLSPDETDDLANALYNDCPY
jgi:hypothetical protein